MAGAGDQICDEGGEVIPASITTPAIYLQVGMTEFISRSLDLDTDKVRFEANGKVLVLSPRHLFQAVGLL